MRSPARTLYWQIAGLYLLLLLAFSAIAGVLAVRQFDGFLSEVEQRLNRGLATRLVKELAPTLEAPADGSTQRAVKRITGINPSIDLYILGPDGVVRTGFTGKPALRNRVDITKIEQFLHEDAMLPIRAEDPGEVSGQKVFSVAVLPRSSGGGFLYIVLPGMPFESASHMVRTSYVVRGAGGLLLVVLLMTLIAGLAIFFVLTRRFQRLTQTVRRFQEGAFSERADVEPNDQIGRLAATFNEMAETIEMQFRALKQTDQARQSFAANISHDFRTPLTALRGYADRMMRADERLSTEDRRQHLTAVLQSAAQLEHLADQLAIIVQLDGSNDHALKLETFSIAELAQDSVVKFRPFAEERDVTLAIMNPEEAPQVVGDIAMIERALANLIDNALKNTPRGGKVTLSLPVADARVIVRIEDTGCGLSKEDLSQVKQRFFRTIDSKAAGVQGTGLGLSIVDEIITKHGSELTIESRLGEGTVVSFSLIKA